MHGPSVAARGCDTPATARMALVRRAPGVRGYTTVEPVHPPGGIPPTAIHGHVHLPLSTTRSRRETLDSPDDELLLREAFVGVLSHELRTPVTSIYSGIELLRAHRLEDDVGPATCSGTSRSRPRACSALIDDLLVIVRVERGVTMAVPEPVLLRRIGRAGRRRRAPPLAGAHLPGRPRVGPADGPRRRRLAPPGPAQPAVQCGQVRPARAARSRSPVEAARASTSSCACATTGPGIAVEQREQRVRPVLPGHDGRGRIAGLGHRPVRRPGAHGGHGRDHHRRSRASDGAEFMLRLPRYPDLAAERSADPRDRSPSHHPTQASGPDRAATMPACVDDRSWSSRSWRPWPVWCGVGCTAPSGSGVLSVSNQSDETIYIRFDAEPDQVVDLPGRPGGGRSGAGGRSRDAGRTR